MESIFKSKKPSASNNSSAVAPIPQSVQTNLQMPKADPQSNTISPFTNQQTGQPNNQNQPLVFNNTNNQLKNDHQNLKKSPNNLQPQSLNGHQNQNQFDLKTDLRDNNNHNNVMQHPQNQNMHLHQSRDQQHNNNADQSKADVQFEIQSCFSLAQKPEVKLGTGCKILNDFLRGGFMPRRLYEVYGESGTGKTQFAIQLLLNAILPEKAGGVNGGALYVMAAKALNEKRFSEMKDCFLKQNSQLRGIDDMAIKSQIQLVQANNLDDYNKIFLNLAHRITMEQTKLVVIDNILAVCDNFIKADGQVDFIERSNFLQRHTKQLKRLAHDFNLVVVIINNVVADVSQNQANQGFFADQQKKIQTTVPALGLIWTNCINERIGLRKKQGNGQQEVKRTMVIEKSAFMRRADFEFEITNSGLRGKH